MATAEVNITAGHTSETCQRIAYDLSTELNLPVSNTANNHDPVSVHYQLVVAYHSEYDYQLELHTMGSRSSPLVVDFIQGTLAHREKFGGGRGQPLARALGLKHGKSPNIVDLTAGLGRDAFVIASLGCHVEMIERNPILHKLLEDGIRRATLAKHPLFTRRQVADNIATDAYDTDDKPTDNQLNAPQLADNPCFGSQCVIDNQRTSNQLSLRHGDSVNLLESIEKHKRAVLYLDPMYPERIKSALVKKEMRILRDLVGDDLDTEDLLSSAINLAQHRVVVKRPKNAPTLKGPAPSHNITSKNTRYDVYNVL